MSAVHDSKHCGTKGPERLGLEFWPIERLVLSPRNARTIAMRRSRKSLAASGRSDSPIRSWLARRAIATHIVDLPGDQRAHGRAAAVERHQGWLHIQD